MLSNIEDSQLSVAVSQGEPFIFPTETVYGLGAAADNQSAIEEIYRIKNRPADNPLICHFYSKEHIFEYVDTAKIPPYWNILVKSFSPGPLTYLLALPTDSKLKPATRGSLTIGCRIPNHRIALDIIQRVNKPIAAPSANTSGRYSGTNFEMVKADLGEKVKLLIDGGQSVIGLESTIIDCTQPDKITILRKGFVTQEDIQQVLDKCRFDNIPVEYGTSKTTIPGAKYRHYQPTTPISLVDSIKENKDSCYLVFSNSLQNQTNSITLPIDLKQISSQLYSSLFELDQLHKKQIQLYIDPEFHTLSDHGLYHALINRLNKIVGKEIVE